MKNATKAIALIGLLTLFGSQLYAETAYISEIADSKPWDAVTDDGRKVKVTFNPDGSASIRLGIMKRALTWNKIADGLCLKGTPRGDLCMRLEKVSNGYFGYKDKDVVMTFTR